MKLIKSFRGLRPTRDLAADIASHPYDVLSREEAFALATDNPLSFLHVNKPEVDVAPEVSPYDPSVYAKGRENLDKFIEQGALVRDKKDSLYVYQQVMGNHTQTGIVAVASVDAYEADLIRKHEFTRPDKEDDRVQHMDALGAQVGPVFVTYQAQTRINALIAELVLNDPEYDFQAEDRTHHTFWIVQDDEIISFIESAINDLGCLYVADGHHRSAAASRVRTFFRDRNPDHTGDESYNFFLVVLFPHDQMQILDYNRIIKDFGDKTTQEFLEELADSFDVKPLENASKAKPVAPQQFGLYTENQWFRLELHELRRTEINEGDPVSSLDVSILQDTILGPILDIHDQRTDKRVDFVGGVRGLEELERRVDSGQWQAAIALYPTSIGSLMSVADAGEIMPPKSTWFEPKLKSGLIVHVLD
ncbi:MAG: hypothetical protein CMD92_05605 [Gammaproteobacteria bacterium]|nr:hypothetical protein [Gammaproteobacteria bacterium]HBW84594.1 DUF1015 domain-containing protein [Gammaproteobacteria bacterium]|tara:strand:+ start:1670 stop:2926 length:1257 start_codon:yes stop_codon:yes gene_type:complete